MLDNDTKISIRELSRDAEQNLMLFCVGLIKYHLGDFDDKYTDKFDVCFQWGGAGPDFFEIFPTSNSNASICFGTAGGTLACNSYLSVSEGIVGEYSSSMEEENCSINEIKVYILETMVELFINNKIDEILDIETTE